MRRPRPIALLALALAPLAAAAQPTRTIPLAEAHVIRSEVMGENRELQISLPPSYARTNTPYPVLFVLDGSSHILHATATTRFLASARDRIPEMIVVAVPNTNRNRDLTPGPGAVRFERFFADELIPWVNRTFRAAPERLIMGHSLGGSFVVHALLNRPELFTTYVAVSAPLWRYDSLASQARPGLDRASKAGASLHLLVGELENAKLFAGVAAFAALTDSLGKQSPPTRYRVLPGEDHNSTSSRALYAALESRYAGWSFPFFEDIAQLDSLGGADALASHYAKLSSRFGFIAPPVESRLAVAARLYAEAGRCGEARTIADKYEREYPALARQVRDAVGRATCR